jgi:hypothetical protein
MLAEKKKALRKNMQRFAAQHVQTSPSPVPLVSVQNRGFVPRSDDLAAVLLISAAGLVLQIMAIGISF